MILLVDVEKAFNIIQHSFMIKKKKLSGLEVGLEGTYLLGTVRSRKKVGLEGTYLDIIK